MVFTLYYQITEDEQSEEQSMEEVVELCGSEGITDETMVYTDDVEMDGWMPFGEIKEYLDWGAEGEEEGEDGEEGGYTSLYYQITEEEQSDECDMHDVMRLINDGVITDETLVWTEGLDGWVPFEEAKCYCVWLEEGDEEAGASGPPETVYYESGPDESEEVSFEEFKLLVEGGMVDDDTKVWAEGLPEWMVFAQAKATLFASEEEGAEPAAEEGELDEEAVAAAEAEAELAAALGEDAPDAEDSAAAAAAEAELEAALAPAEEKPKPKKRKPTLSEAKPPPSARKGTVKVGGKNSGNTRMRQHSQLVLQTIADQAEFFLRKFNRHPDVDRGSVMQLKAEFEKFDTFGKRELDDMAAMRMLEARGQPHSLHEIRSVVAAMKHDQATKKLTFLEWCCAVFKKSWEELHTEVEVEVDVVETEEEKAARASAMAAAAAGEEQAELFRLAGLKGKEAVVAKAEALAAAKVKEEALAEADRQKKAELAADADKSNAKSAEAEAKVKAQIAADDAEKQKKKDAMEAAKSGKGAKSRMAAFNMMAEGDTGMSAEEQVRMESKQRREAKAAKKALAEEQAAAKLKLDEDQAAAKIALEEEKAAAEAAEAEAAEEQAAAEAAAAAAAEAQLAAEEEAEEQARQSQIKAEEAAAAEKLRIEEEEKALYEEAKRKEEEEEAAKKAEEKRVRDEKRKKMQERAAMFNQ